MYSDVNKFTSGADSEVSFSYKDICETLSFVPVKGTDWMLTYLVRESVISDEIGYISDDIVSRSIIQSVAAVIAIFAMFTYAFIQTRRNAKSNPLF